MDRHGQYFKSISLERTFPKIKNYRTNNKRAQKSGIELNLYPGMPFHE